MLIYGQQWALREAEERSCWWRVRISLFLARKGYVVRIEQRRAPPAEAGRFSSSRTHRLTGTNITAPEATNPGHFHAICNDTQSFTHPIVSEQPLSALVWPSAKLGMFAESSYNIVA